MRAHGIGVWKEFLHNFRFGIGGDIEVFRSFAANDVAHAAPGEVRKMAVLAHPGGNFARRLFHGGFHCDRGRFIKPLSILRAQAIEVNRLYRFGAALFPCQNEWTTKRTTAMEMQESATLNAGQGWANRICRSNNKKSITCP